MNILAILGSSRKGGNTETLLDFALKEAKRNGAKVSKVALRDKSIVPCDGCLKCHKSGKCVIKDDMQEIYQEMLAADGILWSTPVYFWSMTGQTKTVMDRTYALLFPKSQLANKVGGLITVAGSRGCLSTAHIFHMYFRYNSMFFAESATGYASAKGEVKNNKHAVMAAKEMVCQMISMIKADLKYPDEFHMPLHRFVKEKYNL
jgi:multimeric flavodoxin WrbA